MSLTVSEQVGARVMEEARRQGISVDALLERLMTRASEASVTEECEALELPILHLGPMGPLHRRDIYDDR